MDSLLRDYLGPALFCNLSSLSQQSGRLGSGKLLVGLDGRLSGISAYRILTLNDIVVVLLLLAYVA